MTETMSDTTAENPGYYRRQGGEFTVTALHDGFLQAPPAAILLGITPDDAARLLVERFAGPNLKLHVNAYLVQRPGQTLLIDTGAGPNMGPGAGRTLQNLQAAGVTPDQVDAVLLTHFHGDHSGGLATPGGQPVFPRAELLYAPEEAAYWFDPAHEAAAPEAKRRAFAAARTAAAPYRGRSREVTGTSFPGITRIPLPGHTPGHSGWQIGDGPGALLVWGDIMHVPDIQGPRPAVGVGFDVNPAQAAATRDAILARVAGERLLVAGMHMQFPGFCHLAKAGDGYQVVPEPWGGA